MLTPEDIIKLSEVLATKEDIKEIKAEISEIRNSLNDLITTVDNLAKAVKDLTTEYSIFAHKIELHEKWIQILARKLGINLES
jgi:archaellum component FlaC